ncbi:MAG: NAD(+)/NADH kinase, partial [Pseudomonadales bacterium]|nr:NAD(+)/NADH kinase [Pseudomonadales bacterium]
VLPFLERLKDFWSGIDFYCWGGVMGELAFVHAARQSGTASRQLNYTVVGASDYPTRAVDTQRACREIVDCSVDLLVFVGGDGTARDIVDCEMGGQLVLGLPAGVKMHSGVFALNPESAADIVISLLHGELVGADRGEVRDIDEHELAQGRVNSRFYGELHVPIADAFLQHTKSGGRENEALAVEEIVASLIDVMETEPGLYLIGAGSTLNALKNSLGVQASLLGVDVWESFELEQRGTAPKVRQRYELKVLNADASALEQIVNNSQDKNVRIVLSFARNQGILFGRGNQQFSTEVIKRVGTDNILLVSTRTKLLSLQGRPLIVDTGDAALDKSLCGIVPILSGYEDSVYYQIDTQY